MSYILDALRKADAQRGRARLPDLHAQPLGATGSERVASRLGPIGWAAGGVGLVCLAAVAWQLAREPAMVASTVSTVERESAAAPPAAVPAPAGSSHHPAEASSSVPPAPAIADAISPPAPPPLPAPARVATPAAPAKTDSGADRSASTSTAARSPAAEPPAAGATQSADREPAPAPIASSAPPGAPALNVSGGVYSPNPAQRMLVVNGQVFNEGSEVGPGVRLEQVRADRRAVLSFRGQRYSVPY